MDNEYATLRCVLTVHANCIACKMHTREILGSIIGPYDITMDADGSKTHIVGQVDPNYCLKAIARCDGHAKLVWANLSHPKMRYGGYGSYYESRRSLPEGMWHDYPSTTYSAANNFIYDDHHNQYQYQYHYQYPSRLDYTPYYHQDQSWCSIM